ncbi:MAG: PDZ domain-containing protein [Kiritimatiellae bacterium]|jgi:TPR repeat protein|nr:PDZ domain-containing protein [Kiritimatiellia bacterium]
MKKFTFAALSMFYAFCLFASYVCAEGGESPQNLKSVSQSAVAATPPLVRASPPEAPDGFQAKFSYFEPLTNTVEKAPAETPGDDIVSMIDNQLDPPSSASGATGFRIEGVVPGFAADRCGLRTGDVVVGVNGVRVYSCLEATVLKDVQEDRGHTDWIVQRNGVTFKVTLTDLELDSLFGVYHRMLLPFAYFAEDLRTELAITPPSYHEVTAGAWDDSTNNIANLRDDSASIFNSMPARAGVAVYNLATSSNVDASAFARTFLEMFARLKWEDYAGARRLISELRPTAETQDPFLNGLLQFYDCVAEQLDRGELPTPETCNVDVATYAVCMPVPVRYYSIRNAFPSDSLLTKLMTRLRAETDTTRFYSIGTTTSAYRELKKANPFAKNDTMSQYYTMVKAGLVSVFPGGYNPIYAIRSNQGPRFLKKVQEKMKTVDQRDAVGFALAALIPAVSVRNQAAVQKSCSIIYGRGDDNTRDYADYLLLRYLNYNGWETWLETMIKNQHPMDQQPLYYHKLAKIWPWFNQRLSLRPVKPATMLSFCGPNVNINEHVLALCFAHPREPEACQRLYDRAIASNDADDLRRAISAASRDLSWELTDATLKRMLDLMRRVSPALAWESLSRAMNERHWDFELLPTAPDALSDYFTYFKELERKYYPSAYAALVGSGRAPTTEEAEYWYQQAATPAMCRLIGDCYFQGGDKDSAIIWTRRASSLHAALLPGTDTIATMRDCNYLSWKYARDMLVGPPGHMLYDEGNRMGRNRLRSNMGCVAWLSIDTGALLAAIMAKHEGDAAEMVKQIILSTSSSYGADRDLILYEGGLYEDGPSLRKVLVEDVLKVPGVKRKDITALLENGIICQEIGADAIRRLQQAADSLADKGIIPSRRRRT